MTDKLVCDGYCGGQSLARKEWIQLGHPRQWRVRFCFPCWQRFRAECETDDLHQLCDAAEGWALAVRQIRLRERQR